MAGLMKRNFFSSGRLFEKSPFSPMYHNNQTGQNCASELMFYHSLNTTSQQQSEKKDSAFLYVVE